MLSDVISISLINIRSLRSNIVLLLAYLKIKLISIIGITETWISIDDTDIFSLSYDAGYNLYLQPRNYGRGGGVGILIHIDLQRLPFLLLLFLIVIAYLAHLISLSIYFVL